MARMENMKQKAGKKNQSWFGYQLDKHLWNLSQFLNPEDMFPVKTEQERNLHTQASGYCVLSCMNANGSVDRVVDMAGPEGY